MKVAIRVDASTALGFGHLARCLSLAGEVRSRGGEVTMVGREWADELRQWIESGGHRCITLPPAVRETSGSDVDAVDTAQSLEGETWHWLVVDHYQLDERWERALRPRVGRIVSVDDLANRRHDCDLLLDQNLPVDAERYAPLVPGRCRVLLGPAFALIRPEFGRARATSRPRNGLVNRLLIFMGGGDIDNHTEVAMRACLDAGFDKGRVDVVVGAGHAHLASIRSLCAGAGFQCHVHTDRMSELMAAADLAIGAAGSSSWERCSVGLPTIAMAVAENQRRVLAGLAALGAVMPAPVQGGLEALVAALSAALANPGMVRDCSAAAWELVDGGGAGRVCDAMEAGV